ncbi:hypothetical protein FEM48_Zijuj01G0193500 [Ziziphus jujuba var. spinosa]|uniref:Maintenance of Photosystem II under High light 2 C-terminal domain-containing protein n=1 Tax=Ziziphus jujuba var. spinosa TaxID=714518 RepID=A0A978W337_ZIZJJ|nr:hypothetical protein FEM48_Zijuj01G0193500 [Ziziphus jujuba var. spinosa]
MFPPLDLSCNLINLSIVMDLNERLGSSLLVVLKPQSTELVNDLVNDPPPPSPILTKRALSLCSITTFFFSLAGQGGSNANAAILEADDDEELLEKVKKDRKKRLEKQGVINSSNEEKAYLQDVVYKLSKVGQAIDNNDLSAASSVLGSSIDADWVKKANKAFIKLSSSPEEKSQVDTFNTSLASLIASVTRNDVESSKIAFVSSASAFEQWTTLTGLLGQLKGL